MISIVLVIIIICLFIYYFAFWCSCPQALPVAILFPGQGSQYVGMMKEGIYS